MTNPQEQPAERPQLRVGSQTGPARSTRALPTGPVMRADRRHHALASAPRWVGPAYVGSTVCLLPWIVWLAVSLPNRTQAHHWRLAWLGLDLDPTPGMGHQPPDRRSCPDRLMG